MDADISDAIEDTYLKEYSKGEYCHKQSFSWGFQEGVDWVLKQIGGKVVSDDSSDLKRNQYIFTNVNTF